MALVTADLIAAMTPELKQELRNQIIAIFSLTPEQQADPTFDKGMTALSNGIASKVSSNIIDYFKANAEIKLTQASPLADISGTPSVPLGPIDTYTGSGRII